MSDYNKTVISGNVARPEHVQLNNGTPLFKFSLGHGTGRKDADGNYQTQWYNVGVYGSIGERIAKVAQKGARVIVEGRLTPKIYTTKDGQPAISWDLRLDEVVGSVTVLNFAKQGADIEGGEPRAATAFKAKKPPAQQELGDYEDAPTTDGAPF